MANENESVKKELSLEELLSQLTELRGRLCDDATVPASRLNAVHPHYRQSARNLLHYLALRRSDLRPLQQELTALGLSSLGRAEQHVLATVDAVLKVLHRLLQSCEQTPRSVLDSVDFADGKRLLAEHAHDLLGPAPPDRRVRIMVTVPSEAAEDYSLIHNLLEQGMNCMRINCAHDDAPTWLRMIEHLRRAEQSQGKNCRIIMDLAGPKLRTGPLEPGAKVKRIRPRRDDYGRVKVPARIWLTSKLSSPPSPADACLLVPEAWLARCRIKERITLEDSRDSKRCLEIVDVTEAGCWAEANKTVYIVPGTILCHDRSVVTGTHRKAKIGDLPPLESSLVLREGDLLALTRDMRPGRAARHDSAGQLLTPAMIGCTIPEVFEDVQPREAIWFDDGKIGGIIEKIEPSQVLVRITHAGQNGKKLRGDKGINLPESNLSLPALTDKDRDDLVFVAEHADVVELSFANTARDVETLQQHLAQLGQRQPAIVLKIETRRGFENLPDMLLTAMRAPSCGVMIARGDLAVECGFERLAEVQEEILWICEAAHVPVIWATQVLESLAKKGMPSRAEITDAAMGHRAECVMLNKGPHVLRAIRALDDILRRMQSHQTKKVATLRELHLAHSLSSE